MRRNSSRTKKSRKPRDIYVGFVAALRPVGSPDLPKEPRAPSKAKKPELIEHDSPEDPTRLREMENIGDGCFRRLPTNRD